MSLHIINAELEFRIASQRRKSTIASIIIGLLLMALLGLLFWAIGIKIFTQTTKPIVSYQDEVSAEEVLEKIKVQPTVQQTPSSPSSAAVKIITAPSTSSFSVPSPEVAVDSLSVEFGASEGFGDGWGSGSGFGSEAGAGAYSFMGNKMKGDRICFVIDYSISMNGPRIKLLKAELEKTIDSLPNKTEYQMIFFAGPAWIAGSKVALHKGGATVEFDDKEFKWESKDLFTWWQAGSKQPVEWLRQGSKVKAKNLEAIRDTPLVGGTSWTSPLEMAMDMKPKPGLIIFLTDGASGNNSFKKAGELGLLARAKRIKVNTIALMEPKARDAMAELARITGGDFSLIDRNGEKVKQKVGNK